MKEFTIILIISSVISLIIIGACNTNTVLDKIDKNHTEIKLLLQSDFRESIKKSEQNRIKKGDFLGEVEK